MKRDTLLKKINDSGFLFQLAIESEIKATKAEHRWSIVSREHPWFEDGTEEDGFIDLILNRDIVRLVIECKRSRNGLWIFIIDRKIKQSTDQAIGRLLQWQDSPVLKQGYQLSKIEPESPESQFCIIRGGEDKESLLERYCGRLIKSLDCFAQEELKIAMNNSERYRGIYMPIIVTSADIIICKVKPEEILLKDGTISTGEFEKVPFVRFRKSLTTKMEPHYQPKTLEESIFLKDRTVFVVHAASLSNFLKEFEFRLIGKG